MKVSILTWYASIFTTAKIRRVKDILLIFCLVWCITMTVVVVVQCIPLKEAWDPLRNTRTKCMLIGICILLEEIANTLLDISILILPISVIRSLQLPARQRWILSLIFLLGGLYVLHCYLQPHYHRNHITSS